MVDGWLIEVVIWGGMILIVILFFAFEIDKADINGFEKIAQNFCNENNGTVYAVGSYSFQCLINRQISNNYYFSQEEKDKFITKKGLL